MGTLGWVVRDPRVGVVWGDPRVGGLWGPSGGIGVCRLCVWAVYQSYIYRIAGYFRGCKISRYTVSVNLSSGLCEDIRCAYECVYVLELNTPA